MEVHLIAGARPNFMKIAPVHRAIVADGRLKARFIHTGQHYDAALSDQIMSDLGLPSPDHHLGVGSGNASRQTARILDAIDPIFDEHPPAALIVVGDVTSTLAATLAAANREIPVAHVEAGLRSFDWSMPEERNRCVVDRLSRWLFVTERSGIENLTNEGMTEGVHLVGNVMIDSLLQILPRTDSAPLRDKLELDGAYTVVTLHRPGNVDGVAQFRRLIASLAPLAEEAPLIFPVHPRTREALNGVDLPDGFKLVDPLGYLEFVSLVKDAALVCTDSGGLQEETTVLGVPCITLRPNTERPITIDEGTNVRIFDDLSQVREYGSKALAGDWKEGRRPDLWDGETAPRIVEVLAQELA